jgi:hypothetical protein
LPQAPQKRASSELGAWQCGQSTKDQYS